MSIVIGFIAGAVSLLVYILWRMMRSDGWDDSNITNALRLLTHVTLHPEDFGKMWYLAKDEDGNFVPVKQPFWYVSKDELSEVVNTRP